MPGSTTNAGETNDVHHRDKILASDGGINTFATGVIIVESDDTATSKPKAKEATGDCRDLMPRGCKSPKWESKSWVKAGS